MRAFEPLPRGGNLWKAVVVAAVLLLGLGRLWVELQPRPGLSSEEKRQVQRLDGHLDSLLPTVDDLDGFEATMLDCTRPDNRSGQDYQLKFYNLSGGQQVEEIKSAETDAVRADIEFCDDSKSIWVGVSVGLALDKPTIDYWREAYADLADGDNEDRRLLSRAFADYLGEKAVLEDASWVELPSLEQFGYASRYVITYPELRGEGTFVYYEFVFAEGVISASLTIQLPQSLDDRDVVTSFAAAFHGDVRSQVIESSVEAR